MERALPSVEAHKISSFSITARSSGSNSTASNTARQSTLRTFPAKSLTDIRIYCYGEREYQAFTKELG